MKIGILFDLDGTLLDTLEDLTDAVNHTLVSYGYPQRSLQEIRSFVGNGVRKLISRSVPEGTEENRVDAVLKDYLSYYQVHCRVKTRPYAGVESVLEQVAQHYPVAIVSNKQDAAVKALCADYFPRVYAAGETPDCPRKPAPDMVHAAIAALGVDTCIYVGDSEVDVETAKNAGVPCLSVLWGFRDEGMLRQVGGRFFCHRAEQLPQMLKNIAGEVYGQ